jgi:Tfp pilus assembly protein PilF
MAPSAAANLENLAVAEKDSQRREDIYSLLAQYYLGTGQFEKAVAKYQQVIEINPNNMAAQNNVAFTLAVQLKRPADALPMAEKALELAPNNPTTLDTIGVVHMELGNLAKAEEHLKRSVEASKADNDLIPALLHLTDTQLRLNKKAEAEKPFTQAKKRIDTDPNLQRQFEADLKRLQQEFDGK